MLINLLHELKMKMSGVILNIPEKSSKIFDTSDQFSLIVQE